MHLRERPTIPPSESPDDETLVIGGTGKTGRRAR